MDKEQIKKALDAFEDERYSDAKDILKKEIEVSKNDFIKDKLDIDISPAEEPKADPEPKDEE